jgi:4,5-dihydroxyphthalate decarboxylase
MANTAIRMVSYNWDHIQPIVSGDVTPEGIDFTLDRKTSISAFPADPTIDMSETSLSLYLIGLARGVRDLVGLPVFPMRSFRHRCFLVRRDSPLQDFSDLVGKRIGTDAWPNSGNTWSRAAIREQGIDITRMTWIVGPVDDPNTIQRNRLAFEYPPHVEQAPEGKTLMGMLLDGEVDALLIPWAPRDVFSPEGTIVHLYRDFRAAELAYYQRVGYCPGLHVVAMRRDVFERDPSVAPRLVAAFDESKRRWREDRRKFADTTPWILAELEETALTLGEDWQHSGVAANRKMIAAFCEEQLAQGLVSQALDPNSAFADYEAATT